jgi:outer membrane protein assembly factor BamB
MLLILAALAQAAAAALMTLDLRWLVPLDTPPAAPAAYDAATAYVPLRGGGLVAVDLDRGVVRWRREQSSTIAPSSGDGLVFVGTDGLVEALAERSGVTMWRAPLPGRLVTVTWDNGWLICSTEAGDLAALRASDGELVWRTTVGAALVVPPAAGLDRLYLALEGAQVLSVDLATGQKGWARTLTAGSPACRLDGQLIVVHHDNAVFSLDLVTGRQRWRWLVRRRVWSSHERRTACISLLATTCCVQWPWWGSLRWNAELSSRPVGGPQVYRRDLRALANAVAVFDSHRSRWAISCVGELSAHRTCVSAPADRRPAGDRDT